MIFIKLLLLTIVLVFIVDISGIVYDISKFLYTRLNPNKPYFGQLIPKPFSCSFCLSWWFTIGYSLFNNIPIIESFALGVLFATASILIKNGFKKIMGYINGM